MDSKSLPVVVGVLLIAVVFGVVYAGVRPNAAPPAELAPIAVGESVTADVSTSTVATSTEQ